jgi:cytochrome P450
MDIISEFPTFLVVGHETTSTTTAWGLFALTQNQEVQDKLRKELLAVGTDNPTMDELNALPYLDAVVREILRLYPPLASTMRCAAKDDIIPLGEPVKDKNGNVLDGIK